MAARKKSRSRPAGPDRAGRTAAQNRDCPPAPSDSPESGVHVPVLLEEVLSFFQPKPGLRVLDATLGLGGHAEALLGKAREALCPDCALLGLDRDASALARARERLAPCAGSVHYSHRPFSECAEALDELGWDGVDFALADIGVSSMQLDEAGRGFSFRHDGPLDMRMNPEHGVSAERLVNEAPVSRLRDILREYGEEPMAGRIARAVDNARAKGRITGTLELAGIVERAYPAKWRATSRRHPATRTFQALRMAVNDEAGELAAFLRAVTPRLRPGGRLAIITFHSLEDRMVKHFFRDEAAPCRCPPQAALCLCGKRPGLTILTRKALVPGQDEAARNPRARSAKLRVAEKVRDA